MIRKQCLDGTWSVHHTYHSDFVLALMEEGPLGRHGLTSDELRQAEHYDQEKLAIEVKVTNSVLSVDVVSRHLP